MGDILLATNLPNLLSARFSMAILFYVPTDSCFAATAASGFGIARSFADFVADIVVLIAVAAG